jgi:hypothetical protein
LDAIFDVLHPLQGPIDHLTSLLLKDRLPSQCGLTVWTMGQFMLDDYIGGRRLHQGITGMIGLTTGFALTFLVQAFRLALPPI